MPEYTKFYINLKRSPERCAKFDDTWTRFEAVDYKDLEDDNIMYSRMVSMWNILPEEHKAKTACFMSHYNLLRKIAEQRLSHVIICEDDALQIGDLPDPTELGEEYCYLGGYFSNLKLTKGHLREKVPSTQGLNELNRETHRMLMMVSYYIPHYDIAQKIVDSINSKARVRAIDCMTHTFPIPMNYWYPAVFVEEPGKSTIRSKKTKHCDSEYLLR